MKKKYGKLESQKAMKAGKPGKAQSLEADGKLESYEAYSCSTTWWQLALLYRTYTARTKPMIGRTFYGHAQFMYKCKKQRYEIITVVYALCVVVTFRRL